MKGYSFSIILFCALTISCQEQNTLTRSEKTTIYSVQGDAEQYQKDTIRFIEEEIFGSNGVLTRRNFLNPDGTLKAYEVFEETKNKAGSKYFDNQDNLLSYYQFEHNDQDQKISSKAYDASNDELLRIETYAYDAKGNRTKKEIRNAQQELQRTFIFSHDDHGNENSLTLVNELGKLLYREDYLVTSSHKDGKWKELWGFVGTKANTCKTKEVSFKSK